MNNLENRIALALVAFKRSEGFSLTTEQYESLIDQLALACSDLSAGKDHYEDFYKACLSY